MTVTTGQETPFIGPRPFIEADAQIFFGRQDELAALAAEVVSSQIVLLYAASGSGKSSLIGAGLIPTLRDKGFKIAQERLNVPASGDRQVDVDALCEAITASARPSPDGQPSLLILDQFEQAVTAVTYIQLSAVAETIYRVMAENPLARIVISFREEYLARIDALFGAVSDISTGSYHLDRLSRDGALEAFRRSLDAFGFGVEEQAGGAFLQQITPPTRRVRSEAGFEPLYLQLLGSQLWSAIGDRRATETSPDGESPDTRPVVTVADVDGLVDFDQAIGIFYNSRIGQVCRSHRLTQKTMRDWIDRELVTSDETRSMVRREPEETEGIPTAALDKLAEYGLLRAEPRGDNVWIELAHDQLVERVRELNRSWWNDQVHTRLLDRGERFNIAWSASNLDGVQWVVSRSSFWNFAAAARESGINFSRRYVYWLPFGKKGSPGKVDRLSLRAFVISGTVFNSLVFVYRSATRPPAPSAAFNTIEGLDPETAKRRLRATALNLGWTDQILYAVDVTAMITWATLLSRVITRSAVGAPPAGTRRRFYTAALLGVDTGLSLLRWVIRTGLIENCLSEDQQFMGRQDVRESVRRGEAADVRHATNLQEVASWSRDCPVLVMLDWRSGVDDADEFERYRDRQVPLFENALKTRGAIVAWCCRDEVRRRGWRNSISGLGYPGLGQRTCYMIEHGHVVAWRRITGFEQAERAEPAPGSGPGVGTQQNYLQQMEKRFTAIMTSLIVSSEAAPTRWREYWDNYFKSALGRRRGET